ncbi:replicative DNA helicase [Bacillus sp. SCS-153A]|uniref:replicative DNA helicase n=1 Tax=Rossellomorea sedimentorum TaxID=3115294 RepID=UPI003906D1DB
MKKDQAGHLFSLSPSVDEELSRQQELYEAESMLLGAVFLEPSAINDIILKPENFSQMRNRIIFKAMKSLQRDGLEINPVTIVDRLGDGIENVGSLSYITDIACCCPSISGLDDYQKIVLERYRLRKLQESASQFLNDPSSVKAEALYEMFVGTQEMVLQQHETKSDPLFEIVESFCSEPEHVGVTSGFERLDNMTGGFKPGELIIAAGRPSMGKTALVLNMAYSAALNGAVVDFFSLEMSGKQLYQRLLSRMARINAGKWKNPKKLCSDEEQRRAHEAMDTCLKLPLQIHDTGRQTLDSIRARIQKTRRENENAPYLVVIDYLQLIPVEGKFERHDLAIGAITRELKLLAKQYQVPIILLSQLSRAVEQRGDKRPMMSDLRDSGSIEQDADIVMLLYRDEYYNRKTKERTTEVNLAKHRNGPVGMVKLNFIKEYSWFCSV